MTMFSVPEMSCGHCKSAIESAIKEVVRDAQVVFDMTKRKNTVSSEAETDTMVASMNAGGYEAQVI